MSYQLKSTLQKKTSEICKEIHSWAQTKNSEHICALYQELFGLYKTAEKAADTSRKLQKMLKKYKKLQKNEEVKKNAVQNNLQRQKGS